jgi:hypothetical protein
MVLDYFLTPKTPSFAALATRNLTTVLAGILIFCCVFGLKGFPVAAEPRTVNWEIILRDFWGAILRPLVTPYRRWNANARV